MTAQWSVGPITVPISGDSASVEIPGYIDHPFMFIDVGVTAQLQVSADNSTWLNFGASLSADAALELPLTCPFVRVAGGITTAGSFIIVGSVPGSRG